MTDLQQVILAMWEILNNGSLRRAVRLVVDETADVDWSDYLWPHGEIIYADGTTRMVPTATVQEYLGEMPLDYYRRILGPALDKALIREANEIGNTGDAT